MNVRDICLACLDSGSEEGIHTWQWLGEGRRGSCVKESGSQDGQVNPSRITGTLSCINYDQWIGGRSQRKHGEERGF